MTPHPRLRTLTSVVLVAFLGACRGDNGPPTAATLSTPNSADFAQEVSAADHDAGGGSPRAEDVSASVVFTRLFGRHRECTGADGSPFQETDFTLVGTSEGDPRLTGNIEVKVRDFFNMTTFVGPQTGRIVIRGTNGKEKVHADYVAWGHQFGDYVQGTAVGKVTGQNGGRLVAGWTISYRDGGIFGEFDGKSRDGLVPAGIYSGNCAGGRWTETDLSFSPEDAGIATLGSVTRGRMPAR